MRDTDPDRERRKNATLRWWVLAVSCVWWGVLAVVTTPQAARAEPAAQGENLGDVGNKLANPLADLWALNTSINAPQFYDGNANQGDPEVGGVMVFQPVMPLPLRGEGQDQWRVITRPVIPLVFSAPVPKGPDQFDRYGGIGDIQLPLLFTPSDNISGHFIVGGGPIFLFPTATSNHLGQQQWALGPAVVLGYKTENATFGVFPNYFRKIGSADQKSRTPNVDQLSLLYFFNYKLPEAWQVGFNPTITYDAKAPSGSRWNVPVGISIGRTVKVGRLPVNIKLGGEYSVVSQDLFGQRFQFRLQITPVIPSLVSNPILGK